MTTFIMRSDYCIFINYQVRLFYFNLLLENNIKKLSSYLYFLIDNDNYYYLYKYK